MSFRRAVVWMFTTGVGWGYIGAAVVLAILVFAFSPIGGLADDGPTPMPVADDWPPSGTTAP